MTYLHPHRADLDEVYQRYLDRAITDINELADEIIAHGLGRNAPLGEPITRPVLGTGHPLASIFLLKHRPRQAERDEGVAFFGRAGSAILRSARRLNIDPLELYGTNCIKCPGLSVGEDRQLHWLRRELDIVAPRVVVAMGGEAVEQLNLLSVADPATAPLPPVLGLHAWREGLEVLVCPDIDDSLESPVNKRSFWEAFRELGEWYGQQPPY